MQRTRSLTDVLIVNTPSTFSDHAPAAPAILIGMLEHYGYSAEFYDFNAHTKNDVDIKNLAINNTVGNKKRLREIYSEHVNRMLDRKPKYIGISVFTYQCVNAAKLLCLHIKLRNKDVKIIAGGAGLNQGGINGPNLGSEWQSLGLIDYWVKGEGEWPILDIVRDCKQQAAWEQNTDLDQFPYPVYDSYDWSLYKKSVPISGSRGCVRQCTFCDIHTHWRKFVWRSGESLAQEMIAQSERTGISHFMFTDSLINGSMKAYRDFITRMTLHNQTRTQPITWEGQFIFRPSNQMTADDWQLSASAGLVQVAIGIESLSESIRDHMRKKFSNDDIRFGLKHMKQYGIRGIFLMIAGYVTDTDDTVQETIDMFTELQPYANNAIEKVAIGTTLAILPDTPLEHMADELGITLGEQENAWYGPSTLEQRLAWRRRIIEHCSKLGYHIPENEEQQALLSQLEHA